MCIRDRTWEKLREVAETYERATASDTRAMMVNSNRKPRQKKSQTETQVEKGKQIRNMILTKKKNWRAQ